MVGIQGQSPIFLSKKECLTTVKQVFFSLSMEGSLVDIRAY